MPNIVTKLLLFISSYFPLTLIFFVLFLSKHYILGASILVVGLVGLLGLAIYLRLARTIAPVRITVQDVQRRDAEAMSYIVSYIIPFLAIPFGDWEQAAALGIFFLMLGILYVNSNMIHINPMLNLFGYHLYAITLEDGSSHALLTRQRILRGSQLMAVKLGDDILMHNA